MIKRIWHAIAYLALYAANVYGLWYFHSFINYVIMIILTVVPIISFVITKIVADKMSLEFDGPVSSMNKGEEFLVRLKLNNPLYFGVLGCEIKVSVSNAFYGTKRQHSLKAPLRARIGQTITYPVTGRYCGRILFEVDEVIIQDFLGIFAFKKHFNNDLTVFVLPSKLTNVFGDTNAYKEGMEEVEESDRRGSDFSEVTDVREYKIGDKLQNIHWKLTAKRDILMVKERISLSSSQLFIVVELHDNFNGLLSEVMDVTYGTLALMIENRIPACLSWWSVKKQDMQIFRIDSMEVLDEAFRNMFYDQAYDESTLSRDNYKNIKGEDAQFIWIGNKNFGEGEPIAEYNNGTGVFLGNLY